MKNVIIFCIDSLRYDHSKEIIEKLNKILGKGISFNNAFSTGPSTNFSYPGIFSSKFSSSFDEKMSYELKNNIISLEFSKELPKRTLLFRILKNYNYETYGVMNNPNIGYSDGLDIIIHSGNFFKDEKIKFSKFIENTHSKLFNFFKIIYHKLKKISNFKKYPHMAYPFLSADKILQTLKIILKNQNPTKPKFIFINFMNVHSIFHFKEKDLIKVVSEWHKTIKTLDDSNKIDKNILNRYILLYKQSISFVSNEIEKIMDYLEKEKILKNSIVILISDHGEAFNEYNAISHGPLKSYKKKDLINLLHLPIIHVPLTIWGAEKTTDQNKIVSLVDLSPTILDILNIPKPKEWYGESIFKKSDDYAFAEVRGFDSIAYSVITQNKLFFYNPNIDQKILYIKDENKHYDLKKDDKHKKIMLDMLYLLEKHQKRVKECWKEYLRKDIKKVSDKSNIYEREKSN